MAQRQLLSAVSWFGGRAGCRGEAAVSTPNSKSAPPTWRSSRFRRPGTGRRRTRPTLQRWYDNHPDSYSTPEFRRIKAIVLSPQSLAPDITVTDDELHAAYDERKAEYLTPEKRSAEVISAPDEAKARALAEQWRGGADWTAMQAAAKADGAAAVAQDDATQVQFPDPDLAKAVFAAPADAVSDPVKGALGWFVVKVTKICRRGDTTFDQAKDALRARMLASKAADLIYDRANKIDQLLGNGTSLDELPGDLGLAGVAGTLDAKGDTKDGTARADPRPGGTEGGDRRRRVPGAEGRSAATDRGADPVDRRLGVLRADGGERHPAGRKAVRRGEGPGGGRTGSRTSGAMPQDKAARR